MKNKPAITLFTALALMFAWIGQALAAPCPVLAEAHQSFSHGGHDMDGTTPKHGCADCQTATGCAGTSLHCLKADEKANAPVVQKIVKTAPDPALAPVHISFKIKHHRIRGPGFFPAGASLPPHTLNSLHIRLQV